MAGHVAYTWKLAIKPLTGRPLKNECWKPMKTITNTCFCFLFPRHAGPYRIYAELEMSLGNYGQARKILFRGAQAISQSSDGGLGNRRGLSELFHTWGICEWHLNSLPRAEVLFDHALRLTEEGEGGSRLRSFILYSIARLEFFRDEHHLAQHCVGLCLKENFMPGGTAKVWELWAEIARKMGNNFLVEECLEQIKLAEQLQEADQNGLSQLLSARSSSSGSGNLANLIRREPWQFKLFGSSESKASSNFYSFRKFPKGTIENSRQVVTDYSSQEVRRDSLLLFP